jgi:hypothetical protein
MREDPRLYTLWHVCLIITWLPDCYDGRVTILLSSFLAACRRGWIAVREEPGFRYPTWLLSALLVALFMLLVFYANFLVQLPDLQKCLA